MKVTDTLSRVYSSDGTPEISTVDIAHHVHSVMSHLPKREARLKQFQQATAKSFPISNFHKLYDQWLAICSRYFTRC